MRELVIAIDGPAGAGKSTVAQLVAKRLGFIYIDTGAMYRAITYLSIQQNVDISDIKTMTNLAVNAEINLGYEQAQLRINVNGRDVTDEVRKPDVTAKVAAVAQIPGVRVAMLNQQRRMASAGGVVMDGRDICTYVLPSADIKLFLTASISERAKRRWLELTQKGFIVDFEQLKEEIALRDKMDSERELAPLVQAEDAVLLDTTGLTIEEAVQKILGYCEERSNLV